MEFWIISLFPVYLPYKQDSIPQHGIRLKNITMANQNTNCKMLTKRKERKHETYSKKYIDISLLNKTIFNYLVKKTWSEYILVFLSKNGHIKVDAGVLLMHFAAGYCHSRPRMARITWKSLSTCNNKVIVWVDLLETLYAPPLQSETLH